MLTGALEARRKAQQLIFGERAAWPDRDEAGVPSVSVPVLSTTSVSTCLQALERFGVLDQHARLRAAADADHDRHRRCQSERAGAGDDEDGDGRDQAVGQARGWPPHGPGNEGQRGDDDHQRHEPARDLVGKPLNGCAASLRLGHQGNDLAPAWSRARPCSARITKLPLWFRVPPITVSPTVFSTGIGLARHHRRIDGSCARRGWCHRRGRFRPGRTRRRSPTTTSSRATSASRPSAPRRRACLGASEAAPGLPAGLLARLELEHLAQQHEHRDHGGRLEVNRHGAVAAPKRGREQSGAERGQDAIGSRPRRCPVAIRVNMLRLSALREAQPAHEEGPTGPQHHGRRHGELQPIAKLLAGQDVKIAQMPTHFQDQDRQREEEADPEPVRQVDELNVGAAVCHDFGGLERHAA